MSVEWKIYKHSLLVPCSFPARSGHPSICVKSLIDPTKVGSHIQQARIFQNEECKSLDSILRRTRKLNK
jgi:hypothetical protein